MSSVLVSEGEYATEMPATPDEFYARVISSADAEGRLPLSRMTAWDAFPFERDGLRVVPLQPPSLPEPDRMGEGDRACSVCDRPGASVWSDPRWRLTALPEPGCPLILMLVPREHLDLPGLPDDLARELGLLTVHVARAIESLPHIARAHVSRWGDGGAHLHVFFFARPAGFPQLRGTCLAVWDDLLPAVPAEQTEADAVAVARAVVSTYGGQAA